MPSRGPLRQGDSMPRYLRALRLDREHIRGPGTGSAVRVFDRAAHLRSTDGSLIFLTAKDLPDGPRGIRLETPGGFSFRNGLRAGDPYAVRGDWLRLGREGLKIDLSTAAEWRPGEITAPARAPAAARVPEIVSGPERQDLCRATRDGNAIDAALVLGPHIGRGPGLTPAGDDFTVGYTGRPPCSSGSRRPAAEFHRRDLGLADHPARAHQRRGRRLSGGRGPGRVHRHGSRLRRTAG